ncbi:hypothetical protein, partial [Burkholderia ambifaria]|uniref:hypothetical protein n=1 Tax=Burkholderia ambifaria TaxID=152480 RepID=UPI003C7DCA26
MNDEKPEAAGPRTPGGGGGAPPPLVWAGRARPAPPPPPPHEALRRAELVKPDLILLDVMM